jgi:hypothetical protein
VNNLLLLIFVAYLIGLISAGRARSPRVWVIAGVAVLLGARYYSFGAW